MKKVSQIDSNGFFIAGILLEDNEELSSDLIDVSCPSGFEKPKWNGTIWVEGLTQIELDAIANLVQPKSELEILQEKYDLLNKAVSELILV